jgi:hypothetical protein
MGFGKINGNSTGSSQYGGIFFRFLQGVVPPKYTYNAYIHSYIPFSAIFFPKTVEM